MPGTAFISMAIPDMFVIQTVLGGLTIILFCCKFPAVSAKIYEKWLTGGRDIATL